MKLRTLALLLVMNAIRVSAQTVADFEEIGMNTSGFQQDASPNTAFASGDVLLPNYWDPVFQYWEGWAISAVTDNKTPGYLNQYSAIPGQGAAGSAHYAVGYVFGEGVIALTGPSKGKPVQGLWVTNSTYAYYSMRDGDAFAKKFGGPSGMDPDFFRVTFRARHAGVAGPDSVTVYLADFRSSDPALDTILDGWHWVDLSVLGPADSIVLSLESSDVGGFGMNTPAYVCIDRVTTAGSTSSLESAASSPLGMYPNPAVDRVYMPQAGPGALVGIHDMQGRLVHSAMVDASQMLDLASLPSGTFLVRVTGAEGVRSGLLVRK